MESKNLSEVIYFQYLPDQELPIFLSVELDKYPESLREILREMGFEQLSEEQWEEKKQLIVSMPFPRLLRIEEAGPVASRRMSEATLSSRFGYENLVPCKTHNVYRYKGHGILVYSHTTRVWQLGVHNDFGLDVFKSCHKVILNRYLSWALAPYGLVGLWGTPVEHGAVIMKPQQSNGELIILDYKNQRVLSEDGIKRINGRFSLFKLDNYLKNTNRRLTQSEFLSILYTHNGYLELEGFPVAVRQAAQMIVKTLDAYLHPEESFVSREENAS